MRPADAISAATNRITQEMGMASWRAMAEHMDTQLQIAFAGTKARSGNYSALSKRGGEKQGNDTPRWQNALQQTMGVVYWREKETLSGRAGTIANV